MMVRLWVDDEDYGTMTEKAAMMYMQVSKSSCRTTPVEDGEPKFLPKDKQDA